MYEYGSRIKAARKLKRLNQKDLSDKIGMPLSTFSLKEREGGFTEDELNVILRILKMKRDDLEALKEMYGHTSKYMTLEYVTKLKEIHRKQIIALSPDF